MPDTDALAGLCPKPVDEMNDAERLEWLRKIRAMRSSWVDFKNAVEAAEPSKTAKPNAVSSESDYF